MKKKAAKKPAKRKPARKAARKAKKPKKVVALFPEAAFGPALNSVLLVEHEPFKAIRHTRLGGKVVYDTRGAWR